MVKPRHSGFTRIARATVFSWQGLRAAWRGEAAFRQESVVTLLLVPIAFLLGEDLIQTALLIGVGLILLITELLNSAIEAVVDRIGEEHHDLAGRAKDMGSAAVMLSLVLLWVTWGLVGMNRILG
jgi:diacylglycerol kinase (ATP)